MDKTIISKLVDKNINKVIESMTISEDWLGHLHTSIDVYFMNKNKENK